ncbi:MAG: DUF2284 domain-containing protein [Eubacteriaceae bacterium]|nr:DUF2284 domain-containing protein [Eubacteriaceae bacterium]
MQILDKVAVYFENFKVVPRESITLSPEVRKMCERNTCGNYGKSWTCPPALAPIEEIQDKFNSFEHFVVVFQVYPLKNSLDYKGMMAGVEDFKVRMNQLHQELKGTDRYMMLGAGGCNLCKECTYPQAPCRRPEDAIVSAEAYGIDVMKLMRENHLKYNNGPNTVTYIGGILF